MDKKQRIQKIISILKENYGNTMLAVLSNFDSWKILIATILSARSKDEQTEPIARALFKKYKNAKQLANAPVKDVEKIIKKIGFYHQKAKYIIETSKLIINEFKGKVPNDYERLMKCPGVGRKVAGCVLVYAFGIAAIPVDTHVHRISNRLGWVKTKDPEKTEVELLRIVPKKQWFLVNDVLVNHGKTICNPISPFCSKCSIIKYCERVGVKKSR
jgi:endonuclease III